MDRMADLDKLKPNEEPKKEPKEIPEERIVSWIHSKL